MWSYYGSKSKIVHLYPAPIYPRIIEPFAGTARYSLRWWWKRDVLLVDKYPVIVEIWKWLQQATKEEILALPDVNQGDDIRKMNLDEGARMLIGFCINGGSVVPKNIGTENMKRHFNSWNKDKARIANWISRIKNWKIKLGDYREIKNEDATWFIDPPYCKGGEGYFVSGSELDYSELAEWCKSRKGQVIVCENSEANWLPFSPLKILHGQARRTQEVIWSNLPTPYDAKQLSIFDILNKKEGE